MFSIYKQEVLVSLLAINTINKELKIEFYTKDAGNRNLGTKKVD